MDLTAADWQEIIERFKALVKAYGHRLPAGSLQNGSRNGHRAVFNSWFGKRAIDYRNATGIRHDLGTAVNIVTMVFGNMGDDSATGVAFTRNPVDGTKELYGDFLINAQGEDVVAGIRNTLPIARLKVDMPGRSTSSWTLSPSWRTTSGHAGCGFTIEHASCGCSRPATASARRPPSRWRWT